MHYFIRIILLSRLKNGKCSVWFESDVVENMCVNVIENVTKFVVRLNVIVKFVKLLCWASNNMAAVWLAIHWIKKKKTR